MPTVLADVRRLPAVVLVVLACTSACGPPVRQATADVTRSAEGTVSGVTYLLDEEMTPDERFTAVREHLEEHEQVPGAEKRLYGSRRSGDTATFDVVFEESEQTGGGLFAEHAYVRLCASLVVDLTGPVEAHLEDAACEGPTALPPDSDVVEVDLEDD